MGLLLLIGAFLIAVGPSAIFFVTTVSRRPYLLVVSLFGILQGIAALLATGLIYTIWNIWAIPIPWVMMLINITFQEALRPYMYKWVVFCCEKLNAVNIPLSITQPSEHFKLSVCIGMGNGFLNILTISLITLTSAGSTADYYIPQCSCISIYILTAIEALCVMPMHVAWCYFTLGDYSKSYKKVPVLVYLWHLAEGCVTLFNQIHNGCIITIIVFILAGVGTLFCLCRLVASSNHLIRPVKKTA